MNETKKIYKDLVYEANAIRFLVFSLVDKSVSESVKSSVRGSIQFFVYNSVHMSVRSPVCDFIDSTIRELNNKIGK